MIELFHDFNNIQENAEEGIATAFLLCNGTIEQIENENIKLSEGQIVMLIDPDDVDEQGNPDRLEVEAKVRFDLNRNCWVADFKYNDLKYRSEK